MSRKTRKNRNRNGHFSQRRRKNSSAYTIRRGGFLTPLKNRYTVFRQRREAAATARARESQARIDGNVSPRFLTSPVRWFRTKVGRNRSNAVNPPLPPPPPPPPPPPRHSHPREQVLQGDLQDDPMHKWLSKFKPPTNAQLEELAKQYEEYDISFDSIEHRNSPPHPHPPDIPPTAFVRRHSRSRMGSNKLK
jgi:hypothetical protein